MSILNFATSREILTHMFDEAPEPKGNKSRVAKILGVTPSFVSQLVNGDAHLSLDQTSALCELWILDEVQSEYFLQLVILEKASTPHLKKRIKAKIDRLRKGNQPLPELKLESGMMDLKVALKFYASWRPSAVLAACHTESFRTEKSIADALRLPELEVRRVLSFLDEANLIRLVKDQWEPTGVTVGMPLDSMEVIQLFFQSVRAKAVESSVMSSENGRHSTMTFAVSKQSFVRLRELTNNYFSDFMGLVNEGNDEEVVFLALDMFKVT